MDGRGTPGGTGSYPTSSPEARALVEFALDHRNILMVQNFHTSGGFTYRVPGTSSDAALAPKDVAIYDLVLGKKYLEIIGEPVPEAWAEPRQDGRHQGPLRARSATNTPWTAATKCPGAGSWATTRPATSAMATGWSSTGGIQQYGAYRHVHRAVEPGQGHPRLREDRRPRPRGRGPAARTWQEKALLKYQDDKYGGKLFVAWKPYKHPELGPGEIGGWIPKYRGNALPGEPLRDVCEKHWKFELFRAGLLPQVVISQAQVKVLAESNRGKTKVVEVTAVIENTGPLATQTARGAQLNGNREDVVWLVGDRDKVKILQGGAWQRLGVMEGTLKLPGLAAAPSGQRAGAAARRRRPPAS